MYLKLNEALGDPEISLGLKRLHNNKTLRDMNAPQIVLDKSDELLGKSRASLGDRFAVVEAIYPEYRVLAEEQLRIQLEWQERCNTCLHMPDDDCPLDSDTWCGRYRASDRTFPNPCPDYVPRGELVRG